MKVYRSIDQFPSNIDTVITIGTFDGLHVGHKYILRKLNETAKKKDLESVLLTFFPHPRHVLFPEDQSLKLLHTIDEKINELERLGVQHLIIHEFTKQFSRIKSIHFIRDVLVNKLNMRHMVVGYDHHFGRNREGSFNELIKLSELYGFVLDEIPVQETKKIKVSSTKIRSALLEGDVKKACILLGHNYFFSGRVVHGDKLGRTIGFPTANIELEEYKLLPKSGVYAVKVLFNNLYYYGMLNIGVKIAKVEVHIFNFSEDIYHKYISVELIIRLRDGKTIDSVDDLKNQLIKDQNKCKKIFNLL